MKRILFLFVIALLYTETNTYAVAPFQVGGIAYQVISSTKKTCSVYRYYNSGYTYYKGKINIPETVKYNGVTYTVTQISSDTFSFQADYVTEVNLPSTIEKIGENAMSSDDLTSVTMYSNVKTICANAFKNCKKLQTVNVKGSIEELCNINYEDSLANPMSRASTFTLNGEQINMLIIPNTITEIKNYCFYNLTSLNTVYLPTSIVKLGKYCFGKTSITKLNIPYSVNKILPGIVSKCTNLTSLTVDDSNPNYDSRNNCNAIIEKSTNTIVMGTNVTVLPSEIENIGESAFDGCTKINFNNAKIKQIGAYAFKDSKLSGFNIPTVTHIGVGAFMGCTNFSMVDIPDNIHKIEAETFRGCSSLSSVIFYQNIDTISAYAFYGCTNLRNIICYDYIPPVINSSAFNVIATLEVYKGYASIYENTGWNVHNIEETLSLSSPNSIVLDKTEYNVVPFEYCQPTYTTDAPAWVYLYGLSWTSSDDNIVLIEPKTGKFAGISEGEAIITAASNLTKATAKVIVKYPKGDVDKNGTVTFKDAIIILDYVIGKTSTINNSAADVNGDGKITLADANMIINILK